jgi:cob(I)alamin adenosyltransferase
VVTIYTRKGDDGTTGLLYGGRVGKDHVAIEVLGNVDEAQAVIGLARAETGEGSELDQLLIGVERDLWVLMAEVATEPENRAKLVDGATKVTTAMVAALEAAIDEYTGRFEPVREFVVPGGNRLSALLDLGRTVVRRAERSTVGLALDDQLVAAYLNRLSDLLWTLARWQDGDHQLRTRSVGPGQA